MCLALSLAAGVAQISFAKDILQQDHNQFLIKMNDESKPRREAKADILAKGEGTVISFEDLEAKRAEKEVARQARQDKRQGTCGFSTLMRLTD